VYEITPALLDDLPKNGPTDPIEYYRRPLVGIVFRERINRGLRLLPKRGVEKALEIGYGAGAVLLALGAGVRELHGLDLDADPKVVQGLLAARGRTAKLVQGSVYELPYADATFDLIASFSTFEHLDKFAVGLREVARVLKPGGHFLLGMPAVNRMMEFGFQAIGFKNIDDHHITTPKMVSSQFSKVGLSIVKTGHLDLPLPLPFGARVYYNWLLRKEG
jgi:SAM-dependent methyltransferase